MGINFKNQLLISLIGIALSSCSKSSGPSSEKDEGIFEGSEDAQAAAPEKPIDNKDVVSQDVVLVADPEEKKDETSQDVPTADKNPTGGETSPQQPKPDPSVPNVPATPPAPAPVTPPPAPLPFYPAQCAEIKKAQPTATSGNYKIYLNPLESTRVAIDAYCEMSEDGGGWTLLLNYVHRANTNPNLDVKTSSLPLLVGNTLGLDESANATAWGHAGNALLQKFAPKELRFFCRSSQVARVLHFKTNDAACLTAATAGTGSCFGVKSSFASLSGHTGNIPATIDLASSNRGDLALTDDTFGINQLSFDQRWSIKGDTGLNSWECDFGSNSSDADTIHRVYFR